jgi:hypothetical protein
MVLRTLIGIIGKKFDNLDRKRRVEDIPSEEIYDQMVLYWNKLTNLFPSESEVPSLVIDNKRTFEGSREILPEGAKDIPNNIHLPYLGCYLTEYNTVYLCSNILLKKELDQVLAEEVTHSLTFPNENLITITKEDIKHFNGLPEFGAHLYRSLNELTNQFPGHEILVQLDTSEFFPPIGESYLFEGYVPDGEWNRTAKLVKDFPKYSAIPFLGLSKAHNFITHIPRLAGELLLGQYRNDAEALMREHPQLTQLDGPQLWDQYCKPLLENGKI